MAQNPTRQLIEKVLTCVRKSPFIHETFENDPWIIPLVTIIPPYLVMQSSVNQIQPFPSSKMSESHLTQGGGLSFDLVTRPKVTTEMSRHPSEGHPGRLWIRGGLARLPPELIDAICKHLCGCWHCGPKGLWAEHVRTNVQHREALNSLSRTCRFLCSVAQPYLFHALEIPSRYKFCEGKGDYDKDLRGIDRFRNLLVELPHIVSQIRRITLNSITDDLLILRRLTGLGTLRLLRASNYGDGLQTHLSFPCVRNLFYGPQVQSSYSTFKGYKVGLEDAKKDLQAILGAAPRLSCLECYRLWHDVPSSPTIPLKFPATNVTSLGLTHCWLPHETFKLFMASFPRLKTFRLWGTLPPVHIYPSEDRATFLMPAQGPERIADAVDGEFLPCECLKLCVMMAPGGQKYSLSSSNTNLFCHTSCRGSRTMQGKPGNPSSAIRTLRW